MVKAARFEMRVDPEQLKRWKAVADAEGRSVGDWLARLADKEAGTALAILPEPQPGQFLVVRGEPQTIERYRLALLYAIEAVGPSETADAMQEIVDRLAKPPHSKKDGRIFSPGEQALIRKAQMLAARKG